MTDDNKGLLEAIELAMEAEKKASQFYSDAKDKVKSFRGKDLLGQLSRFEQSHYNKLEELKLSLAEQGAFVDYAGTDFAALRKDAASEVGGDVESDDARVTEGKDEIVDILNLAIDAETKASANYARLAQQTDDPKGRDMFRKLADEELLHRRILSDEFYHVTNKGEWVWSE
jgi:rubrerythrin